MTQTHAPADLGALARELEKQARSPRPRFDAPVGTSTGAPSAARTKNPFATAMRSTGGTRLRPEDLLHPEGRYLARIVRARMYESRTSGGLTLELQLNTFHWAEQNNDRVMYKRFSFSSPEALAWTGEFFESLGYDLEELSEDEEFDPAEATIDRIVEIQVVHRNYGGMQADVRTCVHTRECALMEQVLNAEADAEPGVEIDVDPETGEVMDTEVAAS